MQSFLSPVPLASWPACLALLSLTGRHTLRLNISTNVLTLRLCIWAPTALPLVNIDFYLHWSLYLVGWAFPFKRQPASQTHAHQSDLNWHSRQMSKISLQGYHSSSVRHWRKNKCPETIKENVPRSRWDLLNIVQRSKQLMSTETPSQQGAACSTMTSLGACQLLSVFSSRVLWEESAPPQFTGAPHQREALTPRHIHGENVLQLIPDTFN